MEVGTTFTATPVYGPPSSPREKCLVFVAPQNEALQPYRKINFSVKLKPETEPLDRHISETAEEAGNKVFRGLDPQN